MITEKQVENFFDIHCVEYDYKQYQFTFTHRKKRRAIAIISYSISCFTENEIQKCIDKAIRSFHRQYILKEKCYFINYRNISKILPKPRFIIHH
jgi:hypothetical protein